MAPIQVSGSSGNYRILHRCLKCGAEKWNQAEPTDNFETLLKLAEMHGRQTP
jgi:hypothetical protein